jgi:hypothetical protein
MDVFVIFCCSLGCSHFCHPSARDTGNDKQVYDRSHTNLGETVRYVAAVDRTSLEVSAGWWEIPLVSEISVQMKL